MVQKKLGEEIAARKRKQVIRESQNRSKSRLRKQKNTKAINVPGKAGEKRKKKENKLGLSCAKLRNSSARLC